MNVDSQTVCAFVTVYHACKTTEHLLRLQGNRSTAFALHRSIDTPEITELLTALETREPGFLEAAETLAIATAERMHSILDEIRGVTVKIERGQDKIARDGFHHARPGDKPGTFHLHVPTANDKYRANYDAIFGRKP